MADGHYAVHPKFRSIMEALTTTERAELAERTGVVDKNLYHYNRGYKRPEPERARVISEGLTDMGYPCRKAWIRPDLWGPR